MSDITHLKGFDAIAKVMAELPDKIERNLLRGTLRAGAKPVAEQAKLNIRKRSGEAADSIRIGTSSRGGIVKAVIKAGSRRAWYIRFIHDGTKPHLIKPRNRKSLFIAGLLREVIEHPGAKANPFLLNAMDQRSGEALAAMATYARNRLANKHGIDLPDPDVGPDDADFDGGN